MTRPFPSDAPHLAGPFAPLYTEGDAPHLPFRGELPEGLRGTFYRNGPNPQFAPAGRYHWFFGDGMLHAFRFEDGRIAYRNRWVRTPKWELENTLGEALSFFDPRLVELDSTLANTSVLWFGGRLLALEEGHAPFEVDPATLAARGYQRFDGDLRTPFTAHPKIDPVTGELIFFGYSAAGPFTPDVALGVVSPDGRLSRREGLVAPYAAMVHDFAVTQRWIVLPIFPLTGSMERALAGAPPFAWEPELGTHVALVPRHGSAARPRWIEHDPCFVFHVMNAFDAADGSVICDLMKYPAAPGFPRPDGAKPTPTPTATLVRWTIDPEGRVLREQPIDDRAGEFPRVDDRFACVPYRHGYFLLRPTDAAGGGVAHVDHATGQVVEWRSPAGDLCREPVFVPRRAGAPEGDGWLLTEVYRGAENRSDLAVLDARDVAAGPILVAHLSHRVPAGFHGTFVPSPR
jgi:carotenoid cleavage dioxygenase-like enzyme